MPCECHDWGYSPDLGPYRNHHHPNCDGTGNHRLLSEGAIVTATATAPDLTELAKLARAKGKMGVAVIEQTRGRFVAGALDERGKFGDPSWHDHPTAEEALAELREQMLRK